MTTAPKPKWKGFDQLLCELANAMDGVLGDMDASLHAARHVMLLFLKHDAWLARTNQPESYVFDHGGHAVPLDQMDMLNSHFWSYFEAAEESGAFREALARGGPWAEWQFGVDDFAFGLADDPSGPIVGRVRDVQVWARTGKFAKPGRGRKEGAEGRGDPKGYKAAVSRIIADIDRAETLQAKLDARAAGVVRESHVVKGITPDSAAKHLRALLVKAGYSEEGLQRRF
jgi:hypothetical protein